MNTAKWILRKNNQCNSGFSVEHVKSALVRPGLAVFVALAVQSNTVAVDMGWLQEGVRAWYVGGLSGGPGSQASNVQEANLIDRIEGQGVHVIQHQALDHWKTRLPVSDWFNPKPLEEGTFWISPYRLQEITPGVGTGLVNWLGRDRVVFAKQTYTADTLPFLNLLPETALFLLRPSRTLVVLRNKPDDPPAGDYFFDVETGLLLSKTEHLDDDTTLMLTLAEINYDFATRSAFPEDNGPHVAYAGRYNATRAAFLDNQGFDLYVPVISRYGNTFLLTFNGNLLNVTLGAYYSFSYEMFYDADSGIALVRESGTGAKSKALAVPASPETRSWQTNGTHIFCWIPPRDLQRERIEVWNQPLDRKGTTGNSTLFASSTMPTTASFCALAFDQEGYLADLVLAAPEMGLYIDSTQASERMILMEGRLYYETQMKRAVPTGSPLIITGQKPELFIVSQSPEQIRQSGVQFLLRGETGRLYVTERSTDLVHWVAFQTNALSAAEVELVDAAASQEPCGFYRVRLAR